MERMHTSRISATRRITKRGGNSPAIKQLALYGAMVWLIAGSACAQVSAPSAAVSDPVKAWAAPAAAPQPLKPSPEFEKFPRYAGTLGSRRIVLRLGPKTDDPTGVHGEYQFADTGEVILIAGDRDGGTLEAEESNDGTHITGNWVGKFEPDGSVAGDRMNVDDSDPQPFDLHPLSPAQAGAKPADALGAAAPVGPATVHVPPIVQPAAHPHALGGASHLTINGSGG